MKRQKSLLLCKAVSSRSFIQLIKLQLEEPLEVSGNTHPRYMTARDRIRLTDAAKQQGLTLLFCHGINLRDKPTDEHEVRYENWYMSLLRAVC